LAKGGVGRCFFRDDPSPHHLLGLLLCPLDLALDRPLHGGTLPWRLSSLANLQAVRFHHRSRRSPVSTNRRRAGPAAGRAPANSLPRRRDLLPVLHDRVLVVDLPVGLQPDALCCCLAVGLYPRPGRAGRCECCCRVFRGSHLSLLIRPFPFLIRPRMLPRRSVAAPAELRNVLAYPSFMAAS
jgi:hypothetical protein